MESYSNLDWTLSKLPPSFPFKWLNKHIEMKIMSEQTKQVREIETRSLVWLLGSTFWGCSFPLLAHFFSFHWWAGSKCNLFEHRSNAMEHIKVRMVPSLGHDSNEFQARVVPYLDSINHMWLTSSQLWHFHFQISSFKALLFQVYTHTRRDRAQLTNTTCWCQWVPYLRYDGEQRTVQLNLFISDLQFKSDGEAWF